MPHITVASIENIRVQRQLDMELLELDRLWHLNLKALNRERLGLIKDLCRIQEDQQTAQHFAHTTQGKTLTLLTDTAEAQIRRTREAKELNKFDFHQDPVDRMPLHLPLLQPRSGEVLEQRTAREMYKAQVHLQKFTLERCALDRRSRRRAFWDNAYITKKRPPGGGLGAEEAAAAATTTTTTTTNTTTTTTTTTTTATPTTTTTPQPQQQQQRQRQSQQQHYKHPTDRLVAFPLRIRNLGPAEQVAQDSQRIAELQREEEILFRRSRAESLRKSKSPSLPALNSLRRFDHAARPRRVHPSLSNRFSASMDYLPVIKGAAASSSARGQPLAAEGSEEAAAPSGVVSPTSATAMPTIEEAATQAT